MRISSTISSSMSQKRSPIFDSRPDSSSLALATATTGQVTRYLILLAQKSTQECHISFLKSSFTPRRCIAGSQSAMTASSLVHFSSVASTNFIGLNLQCLPDHRLSQSWAAESHPPRWRSQTLLDRLHRLPVRQVQGTNLLIQKDCHSVEGVKN